MEKGWKKAVGVEGDEERGSEGKKPFLLQAIGPRRIKVGRYQERREKINPASLKRQKKENQEKTFTKEGASLGVKGSTTTSSATKKGV